MVNAYSARFLDKRSLSCLCANVVEEIGWFNTEAANPNERVLKATLAYFISPEGRFADLANASRCFRYEDISRLQLIDGSFRIREVHTLHIVKLQSTPAYICGSQIWSHVRAAVILWDRWRPRRTSATSSRRTHSQPVGRSLMQAVPCSARPTTRSRVLRRRLSRSLRRHHAR